MIRHLRSVAVIAGVLFIAWWAAEPFRPLSLATDESPAARIKASEALHHPDLVGQRVTVVGRVVRASTSARSKHQFLNFYGDAVYAICRAEDVDKFDGGGPASLFKDQDVEVTGTLERYQDRLQIRLQDPSQIKRFDPASAPPESRAKSQEFLLKNIGPDAWLSPAGLKYAGRDPEGLTRVAHIQRHARDIPDRPGSHGVFDGGEARTFALIDEAWGLAKSLQIQPDVEYGRGAYLIPMGRRVGYQGGQNGASRGHPPLSNVFLVIEMQTQSVITAYPK